MLEILLYIAYGIALLVWIVLSFLLVRHIQALTEIRGIIRFMILGYFVICLILLMVSFYFLTGFRLDVTPVSSVPSPF